MREFCWACHRPAAACFCAYTRPFESPVRVALIVHPREAASTVGTAWIMRRSISNLEWIRSNGVDLDRDPKFLALFRDPELLPFLLFPSPQALNLDRVSAEVWRERVPTLKRALFFVLDGTWTEAKAILRKSAILRSLPRVSFDVTQLSEYGFKRQPDPACLSSVESVHRLFEAVATRQWAKLPVNREHDQMIEIFRRMVSFQLRQEKNLRTVTRSRQRLS